jgi:ABC-2 type transport system ATP-binding protein
MTDTWGTPAIRVRDLHKSYGGPVVLAGINLEVPEGTVFALLGPNGAGKTTTVNILSTLIPPDSGEVVIAGHDLAREPEAVRPRSASPASSRRWTSSSRARRTCG